MWYRYPAPAVAPVGSVTVQSTLGVMRNISSLPLVVLIVYVETGETLVTVGLETLDAALTQADPL